VRKSRNVVLSLKKELQRGGVQASLFGNRILPSRNVPAQRVSLRPGIVKAEVVEPPDRGPLSPTDQETIRMLAAGTTAKNQPSATRIPDVHVEGRPDKLNDEAVLLASHF
jgi:hypothetical protein